MRKLRGSQLNRFLVSKRDGGRFEFRFGTTSATRQPLPSFGATGGEFRQRLVRLQSDHFHVSDALPQHAQPVGGGVGQVDDASAHEWTAIIDLNHDVATVFQIGHPHVGWNRQALVGGGQVEHIVKWAAGGLAAVKIPAIPRGGALLAIARAGFLDPIAPAGYPIGVRIAATAGRLDLGHGLTVAAIDREACARGWARWRMAVGDRATAGQRAGQRGPNQGMTPGGFNHKNLPSPKSRLRRALRCGFCGFSDGLSRHERRVPARRRRRKAGRGVREFPD